MKDKEETDTKNKNNYSKPHKNPIIKIILNVHYV